MAIASKADIKKFLSKVKVKVPPVHNVLFWLYVFLPIKQADTYLKIYVFIYHLKYICPSLFGWKENLIFKETMIFKLQIWDFRVILTHFECSKNNASSA